MKTSEKLTEEAKMALVKDAFLYVCPQEKLMAERLDIDLPMEMLGIQSISALEMAGYIEQKLGVEFTDRELAGMNCIRDLVVLIDKYANASSNFRFIRRGT